MYGWIRHSLAAGLAVAVLCAGGMAVKPAHADAVKDRVAAMKSISKANKTLREAAKKGDKAEVKKQAMAIAATAEKIPSLFPKGTGRDKLDPKVTRAKPEIWAKWDDFKARAETLKSMAVQIASAADKGDMKLAAAGVNRACGGCHKQFRGDKVK